MSLTLVFREIAPLTEHELAVLKGMQYVDIWHKYGEVFNVTSTEASTYPAEYEAILQYCKGISSVDGVSMYVAKTIHTYYRTEEVIHRYLYEYSNVYHAVYADITNLSGQIIRWVVNPDDDSQEGKIVEWQIPKVNKHSRLFYCAG